jgi:hypothetical protein
MNFHKFMFSSEVKNGEKLKQFLMHPYYFLRKISVVERSYRSVN